MTFSSIRSDLSKCWLAHAEAVAHTTGVVGTSGVFVPRELRLTEPYLFVCYEETFEIVLMA